MGTPKLNKSQQKAFKQRIDRTIGRIAEKTSDQIDWRISHHNMEDGKHWYQIETRIINPDDDYDSGWQWADAFGLGPRGRVL